MISSSSLHFYKQLCSTPNTLKCIINVILRRHSCCRFFCLCPFIDRTGEVQLKNALHNKRNPINRVDELIRRLRSSLPKAVWSGVCRGTMNVLWTDLSRDRSSAIVSRTSRTLRAINNFSTFSSPPLHWHSPHFFVLPSPFSPVRLSSLQRRGMATKNCFFLQSTPTPISRCCLKELSEWAWKLAGHGVLGRSSRKHSAALRGVVVDMFVSG